MIHILLLVRHKYDIELDIIGINEAPRTVEASHILAGAGPTLLKALPPLVRRVAGDLPNEQDVFVTLHNGSSRGTNTRAGQRKPRPTAPVRTRNSRGARS